MGELALRPFKIKRAEITKNGMYPFIAALLTLPGAVGACCRRNCHAVIDYSQDTFTGIPFDFWDWEQVIFEHGEYIYVLEGDADDHTCGYHCWFRVRTERYLAEWLLALEASRQIIRHRQEANVHTPSSLQSAESD